jgi:thiamine phosphate synthase YjbQ (UPF0047 family)
MVKIGDIRVCSLIKFKFVMIRSIKISTKLQETITEVTAKPATTVTTSSPEDVLAEVKTKIHELEAVFVIMTEEMLGESAKQLLEMLHPKWTTLQHSNDSESA